MGRTNVLVCDVTVSIPRIVNKDFWLIQTSYKLPNRLTNLATTLVVIIKEPSCTPQHVKGLAPEEC